MKKMKYTLPVFAALVLVALAACGKKMATTLPMEDGPAVVDGETGLPANPEAAPEESAEPQENEPDSTVSAAHSVEPEQTEPVHEAVRVKGILYYATGEPSQVTGRCGNADGTIKTSVPETQLPEQDDESNFGTGYSYQFASEDTIELNIDGNWMVFRRADLELDPRAAQTEITLPVQPEEKPVSE